MKLLTPTIMMLLLSMTTFGQNTKTDKEAISMLISNFSAAVDARDAKALEPLLHEHFRVVANRFPTDDKTTVLTRAAYLSLLLDGKIGGEKRTVKIESLDINNHIAAAKIVFESDKATFTTYQNFILNANNVWQIVSDIPLVKNKQ
jgi:hypothetical protein